MTPIFLHISSSWVKIWLHAKNQLPRLLGSALKVHGGWVTSYPLSSQDPTHVEVELGCDNKTVSVLAFFLCRFLCYIYTLKQII